MSLKNILNVKDLGGVLVNFFTTFPALASPAPIYFETIYLTFAFHSATNNPNFFPRFTFNKSFSFFMPTFRRRELTDYKTFWVWMFDISLLFHQNSCNGNDIEYSEDLHVLILPVNHLLVDKK